MTGARPWREIRRKRPNSDEAWLYRIDADMLRWLVVRDYVDAFWAWVWNTP